MDERQGKRGLVLTRKLGETVVAGDMTVTVVELKRGSVRLQFKAPQERRILRGELLESEQSPKQSVSQRQPALRRVA
jgi:carbon storage regulator CsrA